MKSFFHKQSYKFLAYLQDNLGYSENTIYTYRINLFEAIEHVAIEEKEGVYTIDLMPYRMHILTKNKKTIYKKISIFKSFLNYLKEQGISLLLLRDEQIKVVKTLPKPVARSYVFEVLEKAPLEEKTMLLMAYALGLRISEIANLKKESITPGWVRIKGKGDKIRQLPLLQNVYETIETYIKQTNPNCYLFEKKGKRLSENQIRYRLSKIFKKIGIKVTPHQLRHAFATDLLEEGARITDVSELLGHSSLETTQIYTKLSSSVKMRHYQKAHPMCGESDGII